MKIIKKKYILLVHSQTDKQITFPEQTEFFMADLLLIFLSITGKDNYKYMIIRLHLLSLPTIWLLYNYHYIRYHGFAFQACILQEHSNSSHPKNFPLQIL